MAGGLRLDLNARTENCGERRKKLGLLVSGPVLFCKIKSLNAESSLENVDVETFELVCVFFQGRQKSKHHQVKGGMLANLAFNA